MRPYKYAVSLLALTSFLHTASVSNAATLSDEPALEIIDPSARDINGTTGSTPVVVQDGKVFVCYVDSNLDVVIASRSLLETAWTYAAIASANADDGHNLCSLGIDSSGYLHAAYNHHSSLFINYQRSMYPLDSTRWEAGTLSARTPFSYPVFVRSGSILLMFYRTGYAGNGDECVNRFDNQSDRWFELACPLIAGEHLEDTLSSPYVAVPRVDQLGMVHLLWTSRSGFFNYGLNAAVLNPLTAAVAKESGEPLVLPLSATNSDIVLDPSQRVSNTGLNILPIDSSSTIVAYLRESGDTFEVWSARKVIDSSVTQSQWLHQQVSNERAPRLRACPTGLDIPEPRPCDMQVLGPLLVQSPATHNLQILYGKTIAASRGYWARPASITMQSISLDGGRSWLKPEDISPVPPRWCEMNVSSGGEWALVQECGAESGSGSGALSLISIGGLEQRSTTTDVFENGDWIAQPVLVIESEYGLPIELSTASIVIDISKSFALGIDLYPLQSTEPMGIVDKSFIAGEREIRIVLWGEVPTGGSFAFNPDRIQIALGDDTGNWGLLWYPEIEIHPLEWTRIKLTWDGEVVRLYRENALVDSIVYSSVIKPTTQRIVLGGVRNAQGYLVRPYSGKINLKLYRTLKPAQ